MLRLALLLVLGVAACPAPEVEVVEAAPVAREEAWAPVGASAHTGILDVEVPWVRAVEVVGASSWIVEPVLVLRHDRPMRYDGEATSGRGVVVPVAEVVLVVDGEAILPERLASDDPATPDHLVVPSERPRRLVHRPRYRVAGDALPERLSVRLRDDERQWVEVPVRGGWRTPDGQPGQPVRVRDLAGRAIPGVPATAGGERLPRPVSDPLLVVPEGEAPPELALDGHALARRSGVGEIRYEAWSPGDAAAAREAAIRGSLPESAAPWRSDLVSLGLTLPTADAVGAWVSASIGVEPVGSLRLGPTGVLRRQSAGPQDRASVARALLAIGGIDQNYLCGDLLPEEVAAFYGAAPALAPLAAPLGARVADARDAVTRLSKELGTALAGWKGRPTAAADAYRLVPEWCWVEYLVDPEEMWPSLDLRPPGLDLGPLPFAWRSSERSNPDAWRVTVFVEANGRGADGGYVSTRLAEHGASFHDLTEAAIVLDVYEGPGGGSLQGYASTHLGEEAGGRAGTPVDTRSLDTVVLVVRLTDPDGIATEEHELDLWVADGAPRPRGWRVVVSSDSGAASLDDVAARYAEAVPGRAADPGVRAIQARHALYDVLLEQLSGGTALSEPSLRLTLLEDAGDTEVGWRFEVLPPPRPAAPGALPDDEARARLAAAEAVARAVVAGVEAPAPPVSWLSDGSELRRVAHVSDRVKIGIPRGLDHYDYGLTDTPALWLHDRVVGAVGWHDAPSAPRAEIAPDLAGAAQGTLQRVWRRWDLPVRCHEARRWAGWLGRPEPEACRLDPEPAASP